MFEPPRRVNSAAGRRLISTRLFCVGGSSGEPEDKADFKRVIEFVQCGHCCLKQWPGLLQRKLRVLQAKTNLVKSQVGMMVGIGVLNVFMTTTSNYFELWLHA